LTALHQQSSDFLRVHTDILRLKRFFKKYLKANTERQIHANTQQIHANTAHTDMSRLKRFLKSYFKAYTAKQIHAKHSKTNTLNTVQTGILRLKKLFKIVP